jgi:23S rRNA maturation-related 3'-5' exoribonuclease YhaM
MPFTEDDAKTARKYLQEQAVVLNATVLAAKVLDDEHFFLWSGSSKPLQHHYGKHGLVLHVADVAEVADMANAHYGFPADKRELFLAVLYHDYGKLWDYKPARLGQFVDWVGTDHKREIHHISESGKQWILACAAARHNHNTPWVTKELEDNVYHAILSHHRERAWGSPVAPRYELPWLLHCADMLSARIGDCRTWDCFTEPNKLS